MDRRRFLVDSALLAAAAGAVGVAGVAGCAGIDLEDPRFARPELLVALGPALVSDIGRRYASAVPEENTVAQLRRRIVGGRPLNARLSLTRTSLAELVRDDFEAGRVVIVDGWVLSHTEARQCALFALLHG